MRLGAATFFEHQENVTLVNGDDMSVLFFVVALAMSMLAVAIVARPLISVASNHDRGFARLPLLIVVTVVLLAIGLYAIIGRPDATFSSAGRETGMGSSPPATTTVADNKVGSIASLLGGLEERLRREPNDADGWLLLAKSYQRLGQLAEAHDAYAKAKALGQSDATLESSLTADHLPAKGAVEIRGRISIAPDLAALLDEAATVFVLAKAVNGSPMPLAVLRKPAAELPFEFTLTDEMSMVRGGGLSSVPEVIVSAKISTSGDALQTDPGYEVHSRRTATADSSYLELRIGATTSTEDK